MDPGALNLALPAGVVASALAAALVFVSWDCASVSPRSPVPSSPPTTFVTTFEATHFLKGNLHTHTDRSDGDSPAADVVAWYATHGYDFLALTDHDLRSDPADPTLAPPPTLRLIPGEEITSSGAGRQVHMNAFCTHSTIGGHAFATAADALAWGAQAIALQGGVALVNHPNFDRGVDAPDLLAAPTASLLEIASGHPGVFSQGVDLRPSHEAVWDWALSHGLRPMGVGVDDMHHLESRPDVQPQAFPGRAWVQVFADDGNDDERAICQALRGGHLYASTGAELARIRVTPESYSVWPRQESVIVFFGRDGHELRHVSVAAGEMASYSPHVADLYVRARVETSRGNAWTPPAFVTP